MAKAPERLVELCRPDDKPTLAQRLLKVFGEDGEHWMQGNFADGDGNYCLIGAVRRVHKSVAQRDAATTRLRALIRVPEWSSIAVVSSGGRLMGSFGEDDDIAHWNDKDGRRWRDVHRLLTRLHRSELTQGKP